MIERVEIPVGEWTFDALAAGPPDGELVLLLHGFPQTSAEWRAQLGALGDAGYRAVAPDQRGYSPRARPEGTEWYHVRHLVADVLAVADWLGGHTFHLVGHDWGAVVAWQVAGRYPDRLRSLTAVSVPHPVAFVSALASGSDDQRDRSSYIGFFRQAGSEDALSPDVLRALFAGSGHPGDVDEYVRALADPGAVAAALNWYRAIDLGMVMGLGPVTSPTLFVWSTGDIAIGREGAEATAEHVAGPYRFEVLEGVSHWIPEEAADDLNRLLLDHLASASGAR
ncbi:MAG: alpha/beta hydrolase [Actinomycetota bacterium]|nr:alpha/beta hydrolase [Actinomycetota bacterium]